MTNADTRLTELAVRAGLGELTVLPGSVHRGADVRAEAHALLFEELGDLPEDASHSLFGAVEQRVLYVHYAEGEYAVGVVLDPPTALHAPSATALEEHVRAVVADSRGVAHADVHPYGKTVGRDEALRILRALLGGR